MDILTVLFYQPIYNLLMILYRSFGGDLGLAIISVALISRIVTYPLTRRQIKFAEKSREMNTKVKEIKEKYKNNKDKQNEEMLKLQSEFLPGQLSGCLTIIVQAILLLTILNVVRNLFETQGAGFADVAYSFVPIFGTGEIPNTIFLGIIDLAKSPAIIGYDNILVVAPYILLAVCVGLGQYFSTKILMGSQSKNETDSKNKKSKSKNVEEVPDFSEIMQKSTQQTMVILPLIVGFASLSFPAGLSLYWTIQSAFVIIQQMVIHRLNKA